MSEESGEQIPRDTEAARQQKRQKSAHWLASCSNRSDSVEETTESETLSQPALPSSRVFDFDLRTLAYEAILRIQCHVENASRELLISMDFDSIHTPKMDKKGNLATQFYKQMAICSGFPRVFEVSPYLREADPISEFGSTVLDVEMEIHNHYSEVMDLVDRLSVFVFNRLKEKCGKQLEDVGNQYQFKPLKFLPQTLRLTFAQGVQMLKEAGVEVDPLGVLNAESERQLGKLVLEKYNTDFYILHRYPLVTRQFFTMPCADDSRYTNSFDAFLRGERIISGAQHVHDADFLEKRATECCVDVRTISEYIDSFRYGTPLHGGFNMVLERVAMLFYELN